MAVSRLRRPVAHGSGKTGLYARYDESPRLQASTCFAAAVSDALRAVADVKRRADILQKVDGNRKADRYVCVNEARCQALSNSALRVTIQASGWDVLLLALARFPESAQYFSPPLQRLSTPHTFRGFAGLIEA